MNESHAELMITIPVITKGLLINFYPLYRNCRVATGQFFNIIKPIFQGKIVMVFAMATLWRGTLGDF